VLVVKKSHAESHVTCVTPVHSFQHTTHSFCGLDFFAVGGILLIKFLRWGTVFWRMSTRLFALYRISIFYKKSVPHLTEFWVIIDLFFSLFYSYILSSHSEIFLLSPVVLHIYPMDVRAFLDSVICHRIEKSANIHFQYQILNLIKLCCDLFWSKYILPLVTQCSWSLSYMQVSFIRLLCLFIEQRGLPPGHYGCSIHASIVNVCQSAT
jgi:hypothetical protein